MHDSANDSAEMARRMEEVGNFSRLDRARQQLFYAATATAPARAQHAAGASCATLVREFGLDAEPARLLKLPDRLPNLPDALLQPGSIAAAIDDRRLDLRLARAGLTAAGIGHPLTMVFHVRDSTMLAEDAQIAGAILTFLLLEPSI